MCKIFLHIQFQMNLNNFKLDYKPILYKLNGQNILQLYL